MYTIKQLRELYASVKGAGVTRRGIDMKNLIVKQLEGKVRCCMPKSVKNTQSRYVISADASILPDAINAIVTGEGATNYKRLTAISCSVSFDVQSREKIPWPPTSKDILE